MTFEQMELLALCVLVALLGAGVIESLKRIQKAIEQNYKDSLARAMTTTDLAVKPPPAPKLEGPCVCEHARSDHAIRRGLNTSSCTQPGCDCQRYRPKRGPWPGEVKI